MQWNYEKIDERTTNDWKPIKESFIWFRYRRSFSQSSVNNKYSRTTLKCRRSHKTKRKNTFRKSSVQEKEPTTERKGICKDQVEKQPTANALNLFLHFIRFFFQRCTDKVNVTVIVWLALQHSKYARRNKNDATKWWRDSSCIYNIHIHWHTHTLNPIAKQKCIWYFIENETKRAKAKETTQILQFFRGSLSPPLSSSLSSQRLFFVAQSTIDPDAQR